MVGGVGMSDESVRILNLRILHHEAETPLRGHDADGTCCLRAKLTPLDTENAPQPDEG
jgi:hypothetical protein